jgi:hypothetical protein
VQPKTNETHDAFQEFSKIKPGDGVLDGVFDALGDELDCLV